MLLQIYAWYVWFTLFWTKLKYNLYVTSVINDIKLILYQNCSFMMLLEKTYSWISYVLYAYCLNNYTLSGLGLFYLTRHAYDMHANAYVYT